MERIFAFLELTKTFYNQFWLKNPQMPHLEAFATSIHSGATMIIGS